MKETELSVDLENFYCPITGEQILDPEQFNPSPATVFLFLHREGSFEFLRQDLKEKHRKLYEDESQHKKLYMQLTEKDLVARKNYLWITYGGLPFGAVSMCFDMAHNRG